MKIIVGIHDISSKNLDACKKIVMDLEGAGLQRMSLLVIPEPKGDIPLTGSSELVSWLKDREAKGDEIVIHGLTHHSEMPRGVLGRYYARGAAEFHTIGYDRSRDKVKRAMEIFQKAGFEPVGFVPPAWLINKEGAAAIADVGLYYTTHTGIHLVNGNFVFSPVIVFGARNLLTQVFSSGLARLMSNILKRANLPCIRVAIHPSDIEVPKLFQSAVEIIGDILHQRQAFTYRDMVALFTTSPGIKGVRI